MMNKIILKDADEIINICGQFDKNLHLIEDAFSVAILPKGNELTINGEEKDIRKADKVVKEMLEIYHSGHTLEKQEIKYIIETAKKKSKAELVSIFSESVCVTERGKNIKAKTIQQKKYIQAINKYKMVFAIGPAGTGKTYLAVASALAALKAKKVSRIILTRPVVEAGEKLGYLPGDLYEKVNPYLRPLYDAFYLMLGTEKFQRLREESVLEIVPLAYMRGRTLDDAFIILDEAQNTSTEQMKMFLTRLGFGSQVVITGDITQIDLADKKNSGLIQIQNILKNVAGIKFIYFTFRDVIRHELVSKIIKAYGRWEKNKK